MIYDFLEAVVMSRQNNFSVKGGLSIFLLNLHDGSAAGEK